MDKSKKKNFAADRITPTRVGFAFENDEVASNLRREFT